MRLLHAADLHLGLRITRFGNDVNSRVREARFTALDQLVIAAQTHDVDLVLIAGDLFDDNHVDAVTCRRALELLEKIKRPVFVLPGNHDPLTPDSVWERPPWNDLLDSTVQVLRTRTPVTLPGASLWPCPLVSKTSLDDPTQWLPARPPGDTSVRIGVAHGSIKDRPQLPQDDHLIDRHVVDARGLDYLALGHWHRKLLLPDQQGQMRTAYPGTHEPMRFQGGRDFNLGWTPYSNAAQLDLFDDDGHGHALLVTIAHAGAAPQIEDLDIGQLQWCDETREVHQEDDLSRLIDELANRPHRERQLLRLRLQGVLNAKAMLRLDELDNADGGVLNRYFWGELNTDRLYAEPTEDELRALAGEAVLRQVLDQLTLAAKDANSIEQPLARQALVILYRLAQECHR